MHCVLWYSGRPTNCRSFQRWWRKTLSCCICSSCNVIWKRSEPSWLWGHRCCLRLCALLCALIMKGNTTFQSVFGENGLVFPPKFTDSCGARLRTPALVQATISGFTAPLSHWTYVLVHIQTILHFAANMVFSKCKICCHLSSTHLHSMAFNCSEDEQAWFSAMGVLCYGSFSPQGFFLHVSLY